jgi:hypothetical protein
MTTRLISALLLSQFLSSAQSITQSFNEPSVGDVDKNFRLDTSAYTTGLPNNVTGSNAVWDFTKLFGIFPMVIDSFITPAAAVGYTGYPSATFAQHRDIVYSFFKSTASPSQTELLGAWSSSLVITFTNSAIVATYPVSYGYNMTDPVSGTFKYNNQNGACNGSITVMADATGTLMFPGGVTFTNVLRLRSIEQLTMSAGIFPVGNIDQFIYSYYVPGKKFPVLTVQYQKYGFLAGQPTITAQAYGTFSFFPVAAINEQTHNGAFGSYPNPVADKLILSVPAGEVLFGTVLYDAHGVVVRRFEDEHVDVAGLSPGVYVVEMKTSNRIWRQKILKE